MLGGVGLRLTSSRPGCTEELLNFQPVKLPVPFGNVKRLKEFQNLQSDPSLDAHVLPVHASLPWASVLKVQESKQLNDSKKATGK